MKNIIIAVGGLLLLGVVWISWQQFELLRGTEGIACTLEAKQCPDGSYVGRTGPQCEFASCPPLEPVVYTCAEGKSMTATFSEDAVELYVSDGRSRTFALSKTSESDESEVRYANSDSSMVLWVKDYSAFLEEGGKTTFASCIVFPNEFPDVGAPASEPAGM